MNQRLAETVIATLREAETENYFKSVSGFHYRFYLRIYVRLDASHLVLYFLTRVGILGIEDTLAAHLCTTALPGS